MKIFLMSEVGRLNFFQTPEFELVKPYELLFRDQRGQHVAKHPQGCFCIELSDN